VRRVQLGGVRLNHVKSTTKVMQLLESKLQQLQQQNTTQHLLFTQG